MMRRISFVLLFSFVLTYSSFAQSSPRMIMDFNNEWKFSLVDDSLAKRMGYADNKWRKLQLPHDWSIEGVFSATNPATTQGGALPGGIGWYRKQFVIPPSARNKDISIVFDGVYRNSEVWINGHYLGKRPNGYISFHYDLTAYLKPAPATNLIAVKVDNSQQPNSRWYTGSGIYRNVWLVATGKIAVEQWGSFVRSSVISYDNAGANESAGKKALVTSTIALQNNQATQQQVSLVNIVYDNAGKEVARSEPKSIVVDTAGSTISSSLTIDHPQLWSVDRPVLYRMVTRVLHEGKIVDSYETVFGVRSFYFDKDKGFFLNDQPLKVLGVCMHHDLGALGAAVNVRAMERQLEILKAMGCNAIRTAHNPPAPELLELCDRMGFLVMVEAFDMWKKKKNKYDYYADFPQWHKKDLEDMVLRDRNHPSVFMWSIGNEIREQFDSSGINITKELVQIIKSIDTTRPVTAGLSEWNPQKNFMYQSGALDVVGLNYHQEVYADFPKHYPGEKFIATENMSALATRGHYDWPSDSTYLWPAKSPQKYVENGNPDYTVSAYDQVAAYWGSTHEQTWKIIKKYPYLSGLFVWTGFDYLGEPTPYPWPARSSYFGIIDLAGFPKDVYYMYQSEWTDKPVLHLFPHWTHKQSGKPVDVWAYYNNADEVELFLNDRSLGVKRKQPDDLHVMWRVPFAPGTLMAVSRKDGKTVMTRKISTAGAPVKIELSADRRTIKADGKDLSYVTIRIVDKDGNLVPDANNLVEISIAGAGSLAATDNGYQADTSTFKSNKRKCWKGTALAIIRSAEKKGNITLRVAARGVTPAVLVLKTAD
jgi:beta-galactosidase